MSRLMEVLWRQRDSDVQIPVVPQVMLFSSVPVFAFAEWAVRAGAFTPEERTVYESFINMVAAAKTRLRTSVHRQILENYFS